MTADFARCPVCWQPVTADCNSRIKRHRNSLGETCHYGTGLPYKTTQQEEYA